ncbi:MAG TPA: hypothetical protein DD641_00330 [Deltaproteobacteria bacterium]|nr:hypothetical protein [Deltaproteobacteria bacterium]
MKLLNELKALGYNVILEGDRIRASYTLPGVPPVDRVKPLLDELREHKEDIIRYLKEDIQAILSMPLSQFKKSGLLCRVRCQHLGGEEVFIASTEKEAAVGISEGLIVYLADELVELVKRKPSPDVMLQIHQAKKILHGTLIQSKDREKV